MDLDSKMENADEYFLKQCYELAKKSNDPSTQNGVIIIDPLGPDLSGCKLVGAGFNRFPHGIKETPERWNNRDLKLKLVVHAETAAIMDAARRGNATRGTTMYGCWVSCLDCARDIIQAGITELVGHHHPAQDERPEWKKGIDEAMILLCEAGVKVRFVDMQIGTTIRFNKKEILI